MFGVVGKKRTAEKVRTNGHAPAVLERSSWNLADYDPWIAEWLGVSSSGLAGVSVTATSALGLTAYWRGVNIIAGTIAGLPLKSYRTMPDDTRERVTSFLDDPWPLLTPFEWKELYLTHLLIYGNAFHMKVKNAAGAIEGLQPIPPQCVTVELEEGPQGVTKQYRVTTKTNTQAVYGDDDILHTPALSLDGIVGLSPLTVHRAALGTGLAADQAAARMFGSGMLIGGMVTTDDDVTEDEARMFKTYIDNRLTGVKNAGDIAFMNRKLTFSPWTQTAEDAQFIESRSFQIEEVARILGIPPYLLAQTEKQTSWGTGVAEQNVGLARYTFMSWTSRVQQRLSRLLGEDRFAEFEYKGLFKGTPQQELEMLKLQLDAGLLTVDEGRRIQDMPPAEKEVTQEIVESLGSLIRSGFDPADAARALGIPPIKHTGLLPVTLQKEAQLDAEIAATEATNRGGTE